jgi:selenocysteine-specific elongation factor
LPAGSRAIAQLRLESPVYAFAGDHMTVRDWSEQQTLAGAVVLDAAAARRAFRLAERQMWLERVAASLDEPVSFMAAHVARDIALKPSRAFRQTRFSTEEIEAAAAQLIDAGTLVAAGDFLTDASVFAQAVQRAAALVDAEHRAHPERLGLPLTDLRNALKKEFPLDEVFDTLVAKLAEQGLVRSGSVIHRVTHRARLPEPLRAAGAALRQRLAARPLEPPSRKELTPDAASERALRFLIGTGEVVEISAELVMSAAAVAQAVAQARTFIGQHGPATVSELRQLFGSSRRIAVPLLEYFDRTFVTLRQGDKRTLR